MAYQDNATRTCYVDHRDMQVSWESPSYNAGCWVGIALGSLFMCPLALCITLLPFGALYLAGVKGAERCMERYESHSEAEEARRMERVTAHLDETVRRVWE